MVITTTFLILESIKKLFNCKNKVHHYPKQCHACNGELSLLHTECCFCDNGLICSECLIYGLTICDKCQLSFLSK